MLGLLRICCGSSCPAEADACRGYRTSVDKADEASELVANRIPSDFTIGLYIGLPMSVTEHAGERGTSPVEFTSHFPEVNASDTMTFDDELTVSVRRRRSFKVWTAVLHQLAGAGTPPRPIGASSLGLVPWLLRYHFLG